MCKTKLTQHTSSTKQNASFVDRDRASAPPLPPPPVRNLRPKNIPKNYPEKDVLDIVPRMMIPPGAVLQEGVVSELGSTVAPDAFILTKAERQADYDLPEPLAKGGGRGGAATAAAAASQEVARRVRHRRDWDEMDGKGFRRYD